MHRDDAIELDGVSYVILSLIFRTEEGELTWS